MVLRRENVTCFLHETHLLLPMGPFVHNIDFLIKHQKSIIYCYDGELSAAQNIFCAWGKGGQCSGGLLRCFRHNFTPSEPVTMMM